MTIKTKDGRVVGNKGGSKSRPKRPLPVSPPVNPDPPPTDTVPTAEMIAFRDAWFALAEPTHTSMALDDAMRREMVEQTGTLARRDECTHVAVQTGNWNTASTWLKTLDDSFEVPGANAKVGIPLGITVTYDANSTTLIDTIRLDGKLDWVTNADTKLTVDTIVQHHTGDLEIGTTGTPVNAANAAEIVFNNATDIDSSVDIFRIGRGLITMGKVRICGAEKVHRVKMTTNLSAGATSFTSPVTPTGWRVGDVLGIGSTDLEFYNSGTAETRENHAEWVTITNIAGSVITFTPALTYARTIPSVADMTDIGYWIGNFTRNVKFYSPSGTAVHRRGHILMMGDDTDVRWASSDLMGRTVKGADPVRSFAATDDAMRIAVMGSDIPWGTSGNTANVQGRYNWHFHRAGNFASGDAEGYFEGLTGLDSPGWVMSQHSAVATITKCCFGRFAGAALVSEIGDEAGTWSDCLMMDCNNLEVLLSVGGFIPGAEKARLDSRYTETNEPIGTFDFGRVGSGYWLRSRVVAMTGCAAQDVVVGFQWNSRGIGTNPDASLTPQPRVFYGAEDYLWGVDSDKPIIQQFDDCEAVTCYDGFSVIKANPRQNHDLRSHLRRFTAWNCRSGMVVEYTGLYTFTKCRVHLTSALNDNGTPRANWPYFVGSTSLAMAFVDCIARGTIPTATVGIFKSEIDGITLSSIRRHKIVDMDAPVGVDILPPSSSSLAGASDTNFVTVGARADFDYPPALTYTPDAEPVLNTPVSRKVILSGTVDDEAGVRNREIGAPSTTVGTVPTILDWQIQLMLQRYGYYTYDSSNWLLIPDLLESNFADAVTDNLTIQYLTTILRIQSVTGTSLDPITKFTNQGALPQRYVDAILIGRGTPSGSPDPNAGSWVVYEDILGSGGLYEGL